MAAPRLVVGPVAILADCLAELAATEVLVVASSPRHSSQLSLGLQRYRTFAEAKVHVPIEVVEAAERQLGEANVVVAIGGGSPIGLGKALALRAAERGRALRFVAIPTTYAGSERTSIFGITHGRDKQTGRDERVRPDIVLYDVELTLGLPIPLTAQSLCNAVAHVASALSTGSVPPSAASHARAVLDVSETLVTSPRDREARTIALREASECAAMLDAGKPGVQHAFAHLLGGAFGIDHAALHSILLPCFLAARPDVRDQIAPSVDIVQLLARAGAPTTLGELGVTRAALDEILATRPELLGDIARAAL